MKETKSHHKASKLNNSIALEPNNCFHFGSFTWVNKIIKSGLKSTYNTTNLFKLDSFFSSNSLRKSFSAYLQKLKSDKKELTVINLYLWCFQWFKYSLISFCLKNIFLETLLPLTLKGLINWLIEEEPTASHGYYFLGAIFVILTARVFTTLFGLYGIYKGYSKLGRPLLIGWGALYNMIRWWSWAREKCLKKENLGN